MKAERQKGLWDWLGVRETDDVIKKQNKKKANRTSRQKKDGETNFVYSQFLLQAGLGHPCV